MRNILIFTCFLWAFAANAQIDKGNKAFEDLKYQEAIEYFEKGLDRKKDPLAAARLADSYRLTGNSAAAEKWYNIAFSVGHDSEDSRLFYAKMLLANGKSEEARTQADKLLAQNPNHREAQNILRACDIRLILLGQGDQYIISKMAFNADGADFCPTYFGDQLIFTSDREGEQKSEWTGRSFTSLYTVTPGSGLATPLIGEVNGEYNDGAAVLTADGEIMYFTRNNYKDKERKKGKNDVVSLILARAKRQGAQWIFEDFFPYNSPEFSNAHPALDPSGTKLIFASNRSGGVGGMDLWKSEFINGAWSIPTNLGPDVNTTGNEIFPFLCPDGTLLFSSNTHPGLGGLDVFYCRAHRGGFGEVLNIGAPINSAKDDFGCISRDGLESGYFSSNANSAQNTEDIYSFKRKPAPLEFNLAGVVVDKYTQIPLPAVEVTLENLSTGQKQTVPSTDNGRFKFELDNDADYRLSGVLHGIKTTLEEVTTKGRTNSDLIFVQLEHNDPRFTLRGSAINRKTKDPVAGVEVKLLNTKTMLEETIVTDAEGKFFFQLEQQSDYTITGQKEGVFASIKKASTMGLDRTTELYVQLTLNVDIIEIGKEIVLEDIYFDLNKHQIRPDAASILDRMVEFMQQNTTLEVELTSHTDARNTNEYNMSLSQRRAESTRQYLISKGVAESRMTANGYGESQLVNRCADGVTCTELEHQKNRRTAFKVLKY